MTKDRHNLELIRRRLMTKDSTGNLVVVYVKHMSRKCSDTKFTYKHIHIYTHRII